MVAFSQVKPASLKMKVLPRYPGKYLAGPGIAVTQANGEVTTSVDFSGLERDDITDPTTLYVGAWDSAENIFKLVLGTNLKGGQGDTGATGAAGPSDPTNFSTKAAVEGATISAPVLFVRIAGYAAAGDGGGALYKKVVSEPSHAGKIKSADGAWWELSEKIVTIQMFGAVGDGTTDDTAAFNGALSSLGSRGGLIYFPPGKYRFNSAITYTLPGTEASITLAGSGQDNTVLYWPNASGGITINHSSPHHSTHMRDLTLTTGVASGGNGTLLVQTSSLADFAQSDFYRVTWRGDNSSVYWTTCAYVKGLCGTVWSGVVCQGAGSAAGVGLQLEGNVPLSGYAIYHNINGSIFNQLGTGMVASSFTQGITVSQSNFQNDGIGFHVPAGATGALLQIQIFQSQFATDSHNILMETLYGMVYIVGNVLLNTSPFSCISMSDTKFFSISDNLCQCVAGTTGTGIDIANAGNGTGGAIANNQVNGQANGLVLRAGINHTAVQGNSFTNNTAAILDISGTTTNRIQDNPGYNPVGAVGVTVGASPFTYTAGASPETLYVFGGTVSLISTPGGVWFSQITNSSVCLGPNESVIVTYSALPSISKMVH